MKKKINLSRFIIGSNCGELCILPNITLNRQKFRKLERLLEREQHYEDVKAAEELEKLPC